MGEMSMGKPIGRGWFWLAFILGVGGAYVIAFLESQGALAVALVLVSFVALGAGLIWKHVSAGGDWRVWIPLGLAFVGPLLVPLFSDGDSDRLGLLIFGGYIIAPVVGFTMMRISWFGAAVPEQPVEPVVSEEPSNIQSVESHPETPEVQNNEEANESGPNWVAGMAVALMIWGFMYWAPFTNTVSTQEVPVGQASAPAAAARDNVDAECKRLILGKLTEPNTASFAPRQVDELPPMWDSTWKYTVESRVYGRTMDQHFYCGVNNGNGNVGTLPWP
jgi:hypothetical protein